MLDGLDLFSGIGGITEGLGPYVLPVAYCENNVHEQANLVSRIYRGELPSAPIWDDVRTLRAAGLPNVDIIYGGFPCQDISTAGRGRGLEGERSGLYWQIHRLVGECRPAFVFLENVPAIRTRGLDTVVRSLTDLGYDCRWTIVSAAEVGAPHLRKRWFLLAHADGADLRDESRRQRRESGSTPSLAAGHGEPRALADSEGKRQRKSPDEADAFATRGQARNESLNRRSSLADTESERFDSRLPLDADEVQRSDRQKKSEIGGRSFTAKNRARAFWAVEPDVGRVAHGVPMRSDRLRGLGNSVVPFQAKIAYERLMGYTE